MTAWMESIELIKLHLDTQGDLLRFQRNTELKRNNKQKYNDMPREKNLRLTEIMSGHSICIQSEFWKT